MSVDDIMTWIISVFFIHQTVVTLSIMYCYYGYVQSFTNRFTSMPSFEITVWLYLQTIINKIVMTIPQSEQFRNENRKIVSAEKIINDGFSYSENV